MDLRDSSLSLWASPVPSKKLDKLWKQKNCTVTKCSPKLHRLGVALLHDSLKYLLYFANK